MTCPVYIQFPDRLVSYSDFMDDLAARIAVQINIRRDDPEFVSQREAYRMFGRGNVERWLRQGKLHPHRRPGKVEYETAELRLQQARLQDYY